MLNHSSLTKKLLTELLYAMLTNDDFDASGYLKQFKKRDINMIVFELYQLSDKSLAYDYVIDRCKELDNDKNN